MIKRGKIILPIIIMVSMLFVGMFSFFGKNIEVEDVAYGAYTVEDADYLIDNEKVLENGGQLYIEPKDNAGEDNVMDAGVISGGLAMNGGALYISRGVTFIMTGGVIENSIGVYGGAIYVEAGATLKLQGGTIRNCVGQWGTTNPDGTLNYAIYAEVGATVEISEEFIFENNTFYKFIQPQVQLVALSAEDTDSLYSTVKTFAETELGTVDTEIYIDRNMDMSNKTCHVVTYNADGTIRTQERKTYAEVGILSEADKTSGTWAITDTHMQTNYNKCCGYFYDPYLMDTAYEGSVAIEYNTTSVLYTKLANGVVMGENYSVIDYFYINAETKALAQQKNGYSYGRELVIPLRLGTSGETIYNFEGTEYSSSSGVYGFQNCTSIERVYIPTTFKKLSAYAFDACTNLQFINLHGNNLTLLDGYVFRNCSSLKSIDIPDSVTKIYGYAFQNCSSLEFLEIGEGITTINNYVFYGTTSLTQINFKATNMSDLSANNYVFYQSGRGVVTQDGDSVTDTGIGITVNVAANVTKIPAYLFAPKYYVTSFDHVSVSSSTWDYVGSTVSYPKIKEVIFEDEEDNSSNCTSIGSNAFAFCYSLENINMPSSLTSIKTSAFLCCASLQEIIIPDRVITISNFCFYSCTSVTYLKIGKNLISIGDHTSTGIAFWDLRNLREIQYNAISLNSFETNNNFSNAGANVQEGATIIIGNSVEVIPVDFMRSNGLHPNIKRVIFEEGSKCETIGSYSFAYVNLEHLEIPESITSIGSNAFYGCNTLKEIHFKAANLSDFTSNSNVFEYCGIGEDIDGDGVSDGEGITLYVYPNVTKIPNYMFYSDAENNSGIKEVIFLNGSQTQTITEGGTSQDSQCLTIGQHAFYGCANLECINLPTSLTSIGQYAFYGCSGLVSDIELGGEITTIGEYAFYNCLVLKGNVLLEKATSIGSYAFYNCAGIETLVLGDGIRSINEHTFDGCASLKTITLGETITTIGTYAFNNCLGLTEINYNASAVTEFSEDNYVFGSVGTSGDGAVVTFGSSMVNIPAYIFYPSTTNNSTPKISEVVFENNSNCQSVGTYAFYGCSMLNYLEIPEKVTNIESYAFYGCTGLTNIEIKAVNLANFTSNNHVFSNAGSLGEGITVTFSADVTNIPAYLFNPALNSGTAQEKPKIISVKFNKSTGEGLGNATIGTYAFYGCSYLQNLEIGENITAIYPYAFGGCSELSYLEFRATNCSNFNNDNYIFSSIGYGSDTDGDGVLDSVDGVDVVISKNVTNIPSYMFYSSSDSNASKIKTVTFEDGSECLSIGMYAFYFCEKLTEINLPESLTSIGNYAFYYCRNVQEISLYDNLTKIGSDAFYYCESITELYIGEEVTSIGSYAFGAAYALTSINFRAKNLGSFSSNNYVFSSAGLSSDAIEVTVGNKVTRIPNYLFCPSSSGIAPEVTTVTFEEDSVCSYIGECSFKNVSKLTSINLPNSITTIDDGAFMGTSITSVTIGENVKKIYDCAFESCANLATVYFNATACADSRHDMFGGIFYGAGTNSGIDVYVAKNVTKIPAYLFHTIGGSKVKSLIFEEGAVCETIGTYAFERSDIENINIPNSVKTIEAHAFANYYTSTTNKTKTIIIGEGVETIGNYAFQENRYLTAINFNAIACANFEKDNMIFAKAGRGGDGVTVTFGAKVTNIPSYLFNPYTDEDGAAGEKPDIISVKFETQAAESTTIGAYAFFDCNITHLEIGESVTSIGNYAFSKLSSLQEIEFRATCCEDLLIDDSETTDVDEDNEVFLQAGYSSQSIKVTIASNVTKIPANLFCPRVNISLGSDRPTITDVIFEENSVCESIGENAFRGITTLTSINFPESLKSIGESAFRQTNITEIYLGNNITYLGEYAFAYCGLVTTLIYKASELDNYTTGCSPFSYAFTSATITIGANVKKIPAHLFDISSTSIVAVIFEDIENSQCISIGDYAFNWCTRLQEINFPKSLTSIGEYAFQDCSKLVSITIGENVTTIGNYAFYNCTAVTEINYSATLCGNLQEDNFVFYKVGRSSSGVVVNISKNVKSIPTYLFGPEYTTSSNNDRKVTPLLKTVTFEEEAECDTIGYRAFYCCSVLTSINLPNSIKRIGEDAFYDCQALTSINIGENVTKINKSAFSCCYNLKNISFRATNCADFSNSTYSFFRAGEKGEGIDVTVFANVTKIPAYMFYHNSSDSAPPNLKSVIFEDSAENPSQCISIGAFAFYNKTKFTDINLPNSIQTIGERAFYGCSSLKSINISDLVTTIQPYTFYNCNALTELKLGEGITTIGTYAFYNCSKLASITIGENVTTIGTYAFYNCAGVKNLELGENLTTLGIGSFMAMYSLESLTLKSKSINDLLASNYVFWGCGENGEGIAVTVESSVTKIPAYLFNPYSSSRPKIISVDFIDGSNCTGIGEYAFYYCSTLTSINLPEIIQTIGSNAFYSCSALTSINIGNNITSIGIQAFSGCSSLTITCAFTQTQANSICGTYWNYGVSSTVYLVETNEAATLLDVIATQEVENKEIDYSLGEVVLNKEDDNEEELKLQKMS